MSTTRFCYRCDKRAKHDRLVDVTGNGRPDSAVQRIACFVVSLGASEVFADRYLQCHECGKVTKQ